MEFSRIKSLALLALTILFGCVRNPKEGESIPVHESAAFRSYWHAGKAEINAYDLIQSRYGEKRPGKAVLIFVTEDLSKRLQVKLDDPSQGNKVNVLKLNFTKNFITGIYPYSLMLSVFTPVNREKEAATVKETMSSQEWCGQVYTQLNLRGNRYAVKSHSYFEEEADERFSLRHALLEDEVWNIIRLDHQSLPTGELKMIPGLFYTRLHHADLEVMDVVARKTESDSIHIYTLTFPASARELSITYEKQFPHRILGWEETWKERGETMSSNARLDKTLFTDYWTKNKNEYLHLRDSLNLPNPY